MFSTNYFLVNVCLVFKLFVELHLKCKSLSIRPFEYKMHACSTTTTMFYQFSKYNESVIQKIRIDLYHYNLATA